jgi:hypothetical protein
MEIKLARCTLNTRADKKYTKELSKTVLSTLESSWRINRMIKN